MRNVCVVCQVLARRQQTLTPCLTPGHHDAWEMFCFVSMFVWLSKYIEHRLLWPCTWRQRCLNTISQSQFAKIFADFRFHSNEWKFCKIANHHWIWIYMINVLLSNSSIKIVCKIFLWYSCNGKYSESNTARVLWLYLLHNHCSQHLVMTMAKWIIIGVITSSSQPELDSSLALHLDCFQNLFALLLCTLLLHFVYLSRQLNMAIEPHLLTLCDNTVNSGHT